MTFDEMTKVQEPDTSPRGLLDEKIREHIRTKGGCHKIEGVYGASPGCDAWVEEVIRPGLGTFTKLYGCSYLYPTEVKGDLIDRVATVKGVWMEDLRFLFKIKWLILPFLPILFIFKGFIIKNLIFRYALIYKKDLEKWQLPDNEFCATTREILRVSKKIVAGLGKSWDKVVEPTGMSYREAAKVFAYNFPMFLNADNAYLSRAQDALWYGRTLFGTLRILSERESQIGYKYKILKLFFGVLYLSYDFRRLVNQFFSEIDFAEIKPTEADFYFTLRRDGYNYGGMTYEERKELADIVDKEKGHIIFGR